MTSQWRYYSNTAVPDTLGAAINATATSLYTGSGNPSGYPQSFPWILELEPGTSSFEVVQVNSGAGTSASPWSVTRGADNTTARSHSQGVTVAHSFSAGDFNEFALHVDATAAQLPHGLPAAAWQTASFASLYDNTLSNSTTASVTVSSIPQTYKHLLLIAQGRLTETSVYSDDVALQFNGDASSVYSYLTMFADNPGGTMTGPSASTGYANSSAPIFRMMASEGGNAVNSGGGWAFIPNYTGTAFNKNFYSQSGGGNGNASFVDLRVRLGVYAPSSQAAVSALSLIAPSGSYFLTGTRFTMYGLG